ncbi:MAG: HAAS signaling domain-containing protein [Brevefilum sp.]
MKLLDLYLEEVHHQLPSKNREDILKEIRSTLLDMIEDRKVDPDQEVSEETVKSVLKDFGSPREITRQYGARKYLIGPRFYPAYLQVLRIVLIIVAVVNILGVVIAVINPSNPGSTLIETSLQIIGGLFSSLFAAFGIVTLSFAGIERTTPEDWKVSMDQDWSPEDLRKHEEQKRVSITGLAIEITLSLLFIAVLNFFLDRVGIYYLAESGWVSAPILNENFHRFIPWITAVVTLDIGLNLYLIRQGYWDKLSVIAKVLFNAFEIAIIFAVLVGPDIFTIDPAAWRALAQESTIAATELTRIMNLLFKILFGLSIFGLVVDSIKRLYEFFIQGNHPRIEIDAE